MTEIYRNDLIYSVSYALDYVERESVLVTEHHSRRVAYLAASAGRRMGCSGEQLLNLAACGALHDNALSEYRRRRVGEGRMPAMDTFALDLGLHCRLGEANIAQLSFYPSVRGAVLYHHENADGSGPLGKTAAETPLFSRLIHIADIVDARFDLSRTTPEKNLRLRAFVRDSTGTLFDPDTAGAFLEAFPDGGFPDLTPDRLSERLRTELPEVEAAYSPGELIRLAGIFSKIIDYKSPFTCRHSSGIADKARRMGAYYGWDADAQARLYLAGALHDVGKLMVPSEILEKPGRLTDGEYKAVQAHAMGSYKVLHGIRGLETLARWAYLHHEKLDGSGYPFGMTGDQLSFPERLLACLDIYQAMREERPYKSGAGHGEAVSVLRQLADAGKLDAGITEDIRVCFARDQPEADV